MSNTKSSKNILCILLVFFLIILSSNSFAAESCSIGNSSSCSLEGGKLTMNPLETDAFLSATQDKVCIVYFYGNSCSHCKAIKPFIDQLEQKYADKMRLTRYEVSDPQNIKLYDQLCSLKDYNGKSIPLIGINDKILVGETEIRNNLENEIIRGIKMDKKICPLEGEQCHLQNESSGNSTAEPPIKGLKDLNWKTVLPIIFVAGLGDGVNPCAFVILIFIMVFLQQISGNKKRLLRVTLTYIIAILLTNVLIGMLYFYFSINVGFPDMIRYAVIAVSLGAAMINIKDFFWYGKGISLGIPKSAKNYLMSLIHMASVPASLILGVSVAILEAPCSIPIYLTVIEVLKGAGKTIGAIFPYILVYNLMFILPLVVLSVMVYRGYDAKIFEQKSLAAKRYMRLVVGIILLLLAAAMLLRWI